MKPLSHHANAKHGLKPKSDIECFSATFMRVGMLHVGVMDTSSYFTRAERWPLPIPLEDMEMINSHPLEDIQNGSLAFLMRNIIASYHQTIELSH